MRRVFFFKLPLALRNCRNALRNCRNALRNCRNALRNCRNTPTSFALLVCVRNDQELPVCIRNCRSPSGTAISQHSPLALRNCRNTTVVFGRLR
jgi:hypothetical protein